MAEGHRFVSFTYKHVKKALFNKCKESAFQALLEQGNTGTGRQWLDSNIQTHKQ